MSGDVGSRALIKGLTTISGGRGELFDFKTVGSDFTHSLILITFIYSFAKL